MSFIRERKPGESQFSQYENLGFAVSCMLMNNNYSLYHIKTLQLWTQEAINQNQFKILFDHLNTFGVHHLGLFERRYFVSFY